MEHFVDCLFDSSYQLYMIDGIHPTRAGYRDWGLAPIENELLETLNLAEAEES